MRRLARITLAASAAAAAIAFTASTGGVPEPVPSPSSVGAVHDVLVAAQPRAVADGYVAAQRRSPTCAGAPLRVVRNGPNKYALGRCVTHARPVALLPQPTRRLLPENAFASLIAEDTCATAKCATAALAARGRWVLVGGRPGVRPRTTADCARYRNVNFATDTPAPEDRLRRPIPRGTQVHWRYATRGGRWVMVNWPGGAPFGWSFVSRSCVPDPPTWSEIALWPDADRAAGVRRPTQGRRVRILRPALRCPSRLRCAAVSE